MANWNKPELSSPLLTMVTEINNRDVDNALQFNGTASSVIPENTIRFNTTLGVWQRREGGSWIDKILNTTSFQDIITGGEFGTDIKIPQITTTNKGVATGIEEIDIRPATTSQTGVVSLVESTSSNSTEDAATASSVTLLMDRIEPEDVTSDTENMVDIIGHTHELVVATEQEVLEADGSNPVVMSDVKDYVDSVKSDATDSDSTTTIATTKATSFVQLLKADKIVAANILTRDWKLGSVSGGTSNWENTAYSPELNTFVAVTGFGTNSFMYSKDGINWTEVSSSLTDTSWASVCWASGLGLFVAVGSGGSSQVATSEDGITWQGRSSTVGGSWGAVCYSPALNLIVALGVFGSNRLMTSSDGINWIERVPPALNEWRDVVWFDKEGLFVAVSGFGESNDHIAISSNGIDWTNITAPEQNTWTSVCASRNRLVSVATSGDNRVMTSTDGVNWDIVEVALNNWNSVDYSPELDLFVAVAGSGDNRIMKSFDGIKWSYATSPEQNIWMSVSWGGGSAIFSAVSRTGTNRVMHTL